MTWLSRYSWTPCFIFVFTLASESWCWTSKNFWRLIWGSSSLKGSSVSILIRNISIDIEEEIIVFNQNLWTLKLWKYSEFYPWVLLRPMSNLTMKQNLVWPGELFCMGCGQQVYDFFRGRGQREGEIMAYSFNGEEDADEMMNALYSLAGKSFWSGIQSAMLN